MDTWQAGPCDLPALSCPRSLSKNCIVTLDGGGGGALREVVVDLGALRGLGEVRDGGW